MLSRPHSGPSPREYEQPRKVNPRTHLSNGRSKNQKLQRKPALPLQQKVPIPAVKGPRLKAIVRTYPSLQASYILNRSLHRTDDHEELLKMVSKHLQDMTAVNLATAFHRLAKLTIQGRMNVDALKKHPAVLGLIRRTRAEIRQLDGMGLGSMIWAQSYCNLADTDFLILLRNTFEAKLAKDPDSINNRTLGCVLSACGRTCTGKSFLLRNTKVFLDRIEDGNPQYLVNLLWAFAKFDQKNEALEYECMNGLMYRISELSLPTKKNLIWAFARLNIFEPEFLMHFIEVTSSDMHEMGAFDIVSLAWACITQITHLESSWSEANKFAVEVHEPTPLQSAAWMKSSRLTDFFKAICNRTRELLRDDAQPTKLPVTRQMLWLLAVVEWKDDELWESLCRSVSTHASATCIEDVAQIMWSLARRGHEDRRLMDIMCYHGLSKLNEAGPKVSWKVSRCLYSMAIFNFTKTEYSKAYFEKLQMVALKLLSASTPQFLANVAWSLVTIGTYNKGLLRRLTEQVQERMINSETGDFTDVQLAMFHQVFLCLQTKSPELSISFPPSFSSNERLEIWYESEDTDKCSQQDHENTFSTMQIEVLESLRSLEWNPILGYKDGYCIDIALPDLRIAIECQGASHYSCNKLEPLGLCMVKRKVLYSRGWKVMEIPFFRWNFLLTRAARRDYLSKAIEATLNSALEEPSTQRETSTVPPTDILGFEISIDVLKSSTQTHASFLTPQPTSNVPQGSRLRGSELGTEAREALLKELAPDPPES